jgi:hypothetical protein
MILLYDKETAIITLPKTGSTSLFETLCRIPYSGVFCIGPSGDDPNYYDHHSVILPQAPFEWRVLIVVRNPLQRFVSLWGHLAKEMVLNMESPPTVGEFVDIISNNDHDFYFYQWNQTKILEKANYKYSIIKSEHMEEELLEKEILHNKGDLLNLNVFNITQKSKPYDQILDKKMIEKLRWWWEPDAIKFEYEI